MREKVSIFSDNITLAGMIFYPQEGAVYPPFPALIICHGVPQVAPDPSDVGYINMAERFAKEGFMVMLFNFRGTGESQGDFDMKGWCEDLTAVINYVYDLPEVDHRRISTLGFSGGAAVSIYTAANDKRISSIVTCASPFSFEIIFKKETVIEFVDNAKKIGIIRDLSFPRDIDRWIEGFKEITPSKWIDKISPRPLLIIHGEKDELIPIKHAKKLFSIAKEPKDLYILPGGEHRLRRDDRVIEKAIEWLKWGINICNFKYYII